MDAIQVQLVQDSFKCVAPIADEAAALFYGRLFELDPQLQELFKTDPTEQGRRLMTMIGVAVRGLGNITTLVPAIEQLGRRHATYGVEPRHYDTVGAALLWTLKRGLGTAFTPQVEAAWAETYTLLATTMKNAAIHEHA